MSDDAERLKAEFVTRYKALCKQHGFMVVHLEGDGYFSAHAMRLDGDAESTVLEDDCQQMLLNPTGEWTGYEK